MDGVRQKELRRVLVATAILLVSPLHAVCGLSHVRMAGHMRHGPYPWWHYLDFS